MDIILHPHSPYVATYLEDVIIPFTSWQDHLHHLRGILKEPLEDGADSEPLEIPSGAD